MHVLGAAETRTQELLPGPFGEQTNCASAVVLDDTQTLSTGTQTHSTKQPVDGARSQPQTLREQVIREPLRSRRGPRQSKSHHRRGLLALEQALGG